MDDEVMKVFRKRFLTVYHSTFVRHDLDHQNSLET